MPCGAGEACATIVRDRNGDVRIPADDSMAISAPASSGPLYNSAAALDQIAHEWGHMVIFHSADFSLNNQTGYQLHEGFADLIGTIVEKINEPSGPGLEESSDYDLAEDMAKSSGQYFTSGNRDDGTSGHTFGSGTVNLSFHASDPSNGGSSEEGNKLNVVFYLLMNGGSNPICSRVNNCNIGVSCCYGDSYRLVLRSLAYYLPSNATWDDLGMYMSFASFDLDNNCPSGAGEAEQDRVRNAFAAVGHPNTSPLRQCD